MVENVTQTFLENKFNVSGVFSDDGGMSYIKYINSQDLDRMTRDPLEFGFVVFACEIEELYCRQSLYGV